MKKFKVKGITIKGIIAATALCLASANVLAAMITVEDSFGVQGSSTEIDAGQGTTVLSIAGFDTSLGTLTGVSLTAHSQINATGTSQNNTAENGYAAATLQTSGNWEVLSGVATGGVFARNSTFLAFDQSSPLGVFDMDPGEVFSYDLGSGENIVDMTITDYSAFTSGEMIDFLFSFRAETIIRNFIESDRAYFANSSNTGAWGKIVATYTYEPAPVPEPGALALLTAGLLGVGLRRKRVNFSN